MLHSVPIVFITALITRKEARDSRRINGHRVVPKPTHGFDLIKVIEENLPCCPVILPQNDAPQQSMAPPDAE
jgi:hypothetical protein